MGMFNLDLEIEKHLLTMSAGTRLNEMLEITQHGDTECLVHTVAVVCCALAIARRLRIKVDKSALVRGGILHDYFLYDWHDGKKRRMIHGFTHPKVALRHAEVDFELNDIERDIIKNHMFPLTLVPPHHRESIMVCIYDKICSLFETFNSNTYKNLKENYPLY